jgi:hypothetical protein
MVMMDEMGGWRGEGGKDGGVNAIPFGSINTTNTGMRETKSEREKERQKDRES